MSNRIMVFSYFLQLYITAIGANVMTSVTAGSLLDDNLWHDVTINRFLNQVSFTVDRVEVKELIKGDFQQMDLDKIVC